MMIPDDDKKGRIAPSLDILLYADKKDEINYLTDALGSRNKYGNYQGGEAWIIDLKHFIHRFTLGNFFSDEIHSNYPSLNEKAKIYPLACNMVEEICKIDLTHNSSELNSKIELIKTDFINAIRLDYRISDLKKALYIAQEEVLTAGVPLERCTVMYGFSFQSKEQHNRTYENMLNSRIKGGKFNGKRLFVLKNELVNKLGEKIYDLSFYKNKKYFINPYL